MKTEAAHNMIMVIQTHAEDPRVSTLLTPLRLQLEDLILETIPVLTEQEKELPTKRTRTEAYMKRTNCSAHLAHIAVNRCWRDSELARSSFDQQ